ncbi:hypothetical protein J2R99_002909 [Rhodopseudomonas julia]|uniref:Transmembrane protein (PGPGW) n=1 Tax=Rhodopseudomonas julia TaxID=200617 RepID=A0ABU0C939_9BRAD|nr:hypothetical protein [Rhodopseudomonas julia]
MVNNDSRRRSRLHLFGRQMPLPHSPLLRVGIGILLILGGFFAFLPVLGVWMLPLGLIVLSIDIPAVRRWRRRFTVWIYTHYPSVARRFDVAAPAGNGKAAVAGKIDSETPFVSPDETRASETERSTESRLRQSSDSV